MFVVISLCGVASAQTPRSYFGVGISVPVPIFFPLLSLQIGGPISDTLQVRANLDTLLAASIVSADVLHEFYSNATMNAYVGGGLDLIGIIDFGLMPFAVIPELHATLGAEYFLSDDVGLYAEVKPLLSSLVTQGVFVAPVRAGANIHF